MVGDGGCTCPGDVAKAFGAGADFVMLGGMFAGHDEAAGEVGREEGVEGREGGVRLISNTFLGSREKCASELRAQRACTDRAKKSIISSRN